MNAITLQNFFADRWITSAELAEIRSAVTGDVVALTGSQGLDFAGMLTHARRVGSPALRAMTFHERAWMLKHLGLALMARKEELYELNYETGATRADGWIDIEGGAGTLFSYSSRGRRELPQGRVWLDGAHEPLSKGGTFIGQHVLTPLQGVAVHINAFNFPVWGMLEKLSQSLLAGVPAIVKPASSTGYLAEAAFRIMVESGHLPPGAVQLVMGGVGDMLDHLTEQDIVSFTGSAQTAFKLKSNPVFMQEGARFIAEQDSLNACALGPDAAPGTPEFDLFIKEVVREMTAKAGQKCTAIRRAFVPADFLDAAEDALTERLAKVRVGNPREESTRMGALASHAQLRSVREQIGKLCAQARVVAGDPEGGVDGFGGGAFMPPVLLRADDPWGRDEVHDIEAFGPVSTLMPYRDLDDAVALANRGRGSLVMSLFTHDHEVAEEFVLGAGAFHGRMMILDRTSAGESTGHGSPLPVLVHGGPGRAGGGEEMGGVRGVKHYMQRTALQGSPAVLAHIGKQWLPGAPQPDSPVHPFRRTIGELSVGDTFRSGLREVTLEDVEHFAHFTGDTFYAHMNEEAAKANPIFDGRVAHGYLILSFAAGLFVDPDPGPVLANTGLEALKFMTPLYPGDSMRVTLTVKSKSVRDGERGEVRWAVYVYNQRDEVVAEYTLLTMNRP